MASPFNTQIFVGKVAIVTGSSRGLGAAIALRLAEHGANVVVNYINSVSAAEEVAAKAKEFGVAAIVVKADVTSKAEIEHLFRAAKEAFGRIDIVMSNSGIEHNGFLPDIKEAEIDRVLAVNVKAQLMVAQAAYTYIETNGRVLLMCSQASVRGTPRHTLYATSKAAIAGMVKCLAWDFGPKLVTVNAVAPGGTKSDMYAQNIFHYIPGGGRMSEADIDEYVGQTSPLGGPGRASDIAGVVALLCSDEAAWVTGQVIHSSGGGYMAS